MRTAILLCALLSGVCALPPLPPGQSSAENRYDGERTDSEEREREAIQNIFDAIINISPSSEDSEPLRVMLEKLRDVALAGASDRRLSPEERHEKYSPAVFDVLEEYGNTFTDEKERNMYLLTIQQGRKQPYNSNSDKAAFVSVIGQLFDLANEPLPGWEQDQDRDRVELEKQEFLNMLNSALDDIKL